jgi:hypothetical protein
MDEQADNTVSKEVPLTQNDIGTFLKIGDYVTPQVALIDTSKRFSVNPETSYKVVAFPKDSRFPGAFIIELPSGTTWGFHFGKGGAGQYFNKVETTSESKFFLQYGELPYFVLTVLKENITLDIKQIISKVMAQKLDVDQKDLSKVVSQLKYVIIKLEHYEFIGTVEGKIYSLTQKGKEFLNAK